MTVKISEIRVGDKIGRQIGDGAFGDVMWLTVTEVTETEIHCNAWCFDRASGAEIDHDLQWGPEYGRTGSYIVRVQQMEVVT